MDRFDLSVLSTEDLMRLKEMIPSDTEAKALTAKGEGFDSLHDSEKCLYKLSEVKNIKG